MKKSFPSEGQYVQVYVNLHKNCLSVQNRQRKVIAHVERAVIRDAHFWVSEAGRQRVLREQCKNVHAKIRGLWCGPTEVDVSHLVREVTYNPYKYKTFVYKDDEEPIRGTKLALVKNNRVFVKE